MKLFICVVLFIFSTLAFSNTSLPSNRHISVTGNAQMLAMPDIAVVYLNVESEQKSSLAAKKEVDERVNNLLNGLTDFDVDEKNVSASNISTEVRYAYNRDERDKIEGYLARRTLTVTLKNIAKLNAFMDFALRVKINAIRNIELKSSNEKLLQQEVNALAVEHAKSRGQSLAKAFGVNLGAIYSINANSTQIQQRYGANNEGYETSVRMADSSAKPGRYLQENMVFSASISVVFDLEL
ncbi:SIMPL domain-containing protein [Colwellia sp. MB3u-70]|uniref:SIMPL domain-containing protein n=1 Tax=unclassified Colwellia TaxID=196834 RepID=UPI0015F3C232|nr:MULTISPECIES: SIMPL domain-containing protein [unclassified Colwellia]MBA6292971.1 SIMPL domain-containing protein [Colwellia sp. MB3u-8]MBA6306552.1 SIMPL domain-containing protein [Colwellia sp. MB3u-70]